MFYVGVQFLFWTWVGNRCESESKPKYTLRSYYTGCIHEGLILPVLLAAAVYKAVYIEQLSLHEWFLRPWVPTGETFIEYQIHFALFGYLIADLTNFGVSPDFGYQLIIHHVASTIVNMVSLNMPLGSGIGAVNLAVLEFGSLWINIAMIFKSRTVYGLRAIIYLLTRISTTCSSLYLCLILPRHWSAFLVIVVTFLISDNWKTGKVLINRWLYFKDEIAKRN